MSTLPGSRASRPDSLDFIFCFISVSLALWVGYFSRNIVDIGLYDETSYLQSGIEIAQGKLPEAGWAPLYACWYFLLNLISGEPVSAYYINYAILSATTTALVYVFLRAYRIGRVSSLAWSTVFIMSNANIPAWPKVSNLALVFVLLAAIASAFYCSIGQRISISIMVAAIVTFLRPEFAFGWIIAFLYGTYYVVLRLTRFRHLPKDEFYFFLVSILLSIGLLAIFGNPLQGSRSFVAFGQHYSLHYVKWHNLGINSWTNWNEIVAKSFGDANSIGSALRANPMEFLRHLASNCIMLPRELAKLFVPSTAIAIKGNSILLKGTSIRLIGIVCISAILVLYLTNVRRLKPSGPREGLANMCKDISYEMKKLSFLMFFVLSIPLGISVLIYPRTHYLVMLLPVLLLASAIFADDILGAPLKIMGSARKKEVVVLYLGFAIFIAVVSSSATSPRPTCEVINALKTLNLKPPLNILEALGGFNTYLGSGFKRVAEYDKSKNESCSGFFERKGVDLVLADNSLLSDTRFKDVADCQRLKDVAFLESDGASGVAVLKVEPDGSYKRIMLINR